MKFKGGAIQLYLSLVFHFERTQGIHSFVITFCHLYSLYPLVYSLSTPLLSIAKSYLPWSSSLLPFVLGIHLFYHQTHHFLLGSLLHAIVDVYYSAQIFLPGSTTNFQYPASYMSLRGSWGHKQCLTSFHHDIDKSSNLTREHLTKYILNSSSMDQYLHMYLLKNYFCEWLVGFL